MVLLQVHHKEEVVMLEALLETQDPLLQVLVDPHFHQAAWLQAQGDPWVLYHHLCLVHHQDTQWDP